MKHLVFTFLFSGLLGCTSMAQNFIFNVTSVSSNPPATEMEAVSNISMKNTATVQKTFKWTRNVVSISPDCKTKVCDPNQCYLATVSSKEFVLEANQEDSIQIHFVNPTGQIACAVVEIKVEEVGNAANTATATYIFNDCSVVLAAKDALQNNIRLFPNPTADYFTLENPEGISKIRVLSYDGRAVKSFDVAGAATYSVAELHAGNYLVLLEDKANTVIKSIELKKI